MSRPHRASPVIAHCSTTSIRGSASSKSLFDERGQACDYRFLEVNPAFERLTGLANAVGQSMRKLVPKHEQNWYDIYGRIAKTGVPERFEKMAAALDQRWYDMHAFRIDEPEAHRVAVLFNDITDRKRTQQTLQLLNESLERLVSERTRERDRIWEVSQDLLGIADVNGVWLNVNPAWTHTLGWAMTDIIGRTAGMDCPSRRGRKDLQ